MQLTIFIIIEIFFEILVLYSGIKSIKKPISYSKKEKELKGIFKDYKSEDVNEQTWYYVQYVYGKCLIVLEIVNLLFLYPKILLVSSLSSTVTYTRAHYSNSFDCLFLLPVISIAFIARKYAKHKLKQYDANDLTISFNQNYEMKKDEYRSLQKEEEIVEVETIQDEPDNQPDAVSQTEDLECAIENEQKVFNEYSTECIQRKELLTEEQMIFVQDLYVELDQYTQIIEKYHKALNSLNLAYPLSVELSNELSSYREGVKHNRKEELYDTLTANRHHYYSSDDYINTGAIRHKMMLNKEELLKYYHQYQDDLKTIDTCLDQYSIDHESSSKYDLEDPRVLKTIDGAIYMAKEATDSLVKHCLKAKNALLEEVLYYTKKRNEVCKEILDN